MSSNLLSPLGFRYFSNPFKGTFQRSFTVLCAISLKIIFRVGSWCLPIQTQSPMYSTLEYIIIFLTNFTRLSLSLTFYSKKIQTCKLRLNNISEPHIYFIFLWIIRFALSCFLSLIITASLLISFPIGTKTLQFPMWIFISEYLID